MSFTKFKTNTNKTALFRRTDQNFKIQIRKGVKMRRVKRKSTLVSSAGLTGSNYNNTRGLMQQRHPV